MRFFNFLLLFFLLTLVAACSSVEVSDYADNAPKLSAEQFFNGYLTAHGVVKDRAGKVIRYFNADIQASWEGGVGTLDEQFVFDDGEQQQRIWTLRPYGEGQYIATAGDVVGEGIAEVSGNSMFLKYILRIPYKGDSLDLSIDDRMYLVSDTVLVNESTMSKFGIEVGRILLVIEKRPQPILSATPAIDPR